MSEERDIQFLKEEPRTISVGVYVVGSLAIHLLLLTFWFVYRPLPVASVEEPLRYVEFVSRQPETPRVIEGVGAPVESAPRPDAPLSNANRVARAPEPSSGPRERLAGSPSNSAPAAAPSQTRSEQQPQSTPQQKAPADQVAPQRPDNQLTYQVAKATTAPQVDWKAALRSISGAAEPARSGGGPDGEAGFAEAGPISFESQWYDWGNYADHMIRRIKLHWHANMPAIIRVGVKGVVTLRFTIERNGTISEVVVVESSGVPPYDFAAKKAVELSSKLNPLPADFPGARERVTARFFYNMDVRK